MIDRHRFGEYYLVKLKNENASTASHPVSFGWEIGQEGGTGHFHPMVHIVYPEGTHYNDTGNEFRKTFSDIVVPEDAWHALRIQQDASSQTHWLVFYDETQLGRYWWPYPISNTSWTQTEAYWDDSEPPYFFMGRHDLFRLRTAKGYWSLMDTGWSNRLGQLNSAVYTIRYNDLYYDWEARD
ncbi:MAG: hypothetical protein WBI63_01800 [Coriobacteriia bacterium]